MRPVYPLRFWLVLGGICAALFGVDLYTVESGAGTRADRSLDLAIHNRFGHGTFSAFTLISDIGGSSARTLLLVLMALALILAGRRRGATILLVAMAGGALLNLLVKDVVARPRPHLFGDALRAGGYSFPSGHAMSTTIFFGVLIYLSWTLTGRRWLVGAVTVVALFLSAMVGLSRIVLGVHYPSDVVAGFLLGITWLSCVFPGTFLVERAIAQRIDR